MASVVDLRTDTVTRPTSEMRKAMAEAEVGDATFGEDPTVIRLEAVLRELLDQPAVAFVTSGTVANQCAIAALCRPGQEIIADPSAHVLLYQRAGLAVHFGLQIRSVSPERRGGAVSPKGIADLTGERAYGGPETTAVAIENTQNRRGGTPYTLAELAALRQATRESGLALHCDGARVWNAAVATGVTVAEVAEHVDTLAACFTKGLGAPFGACVAGPVDVVNRARQLAARLCGNLRQAGVMAAAALVAIEPANIARLCDDHERAAALAAQLAEAPGCDVSQATNFVLLTLTKARADRLVSGCAEAGVLIDPLDPRTVRLVTHRDLDDQCIEAAAAVVSDQLVRLDN